ncbi:MAG: dehydratase [Blastopirellula sp.]|nr:MAG: dehydratase [Blastopirellula sp.]
MPERLLHFDEIEIGNYWASSTRTITKSDVSRFAELTGDFDPLHMDHHFAAETPFGRPIAHGLLGLSVMAGLSSRCPHVATAAFVRMSDWHFVKPIFFGDTVYVTTEVLEKNIKGRRRGNIIWKRMLINQHGDVVQHGILETIVNVSEQQCIKKLSTIDELTCSDDQP